ncbi:conserved hypothetical protein [Leishmania infantum JPCM5]|uniref:Uncharacterized protein n=3 Tax=Leishmania donovani species complex TaxID=38574 RepID=A4IBF6_LEIIN|nr:conserved hypothetical protein [Leishmania infantum JPCM5]XP_003864830.1 hypothetical protein, conserved [Leishmania donovani]CAC9544953.1 hypothetical_protein_-_conserved [Leishmania infantum]AYU83050.1 hypothetical protein LdCL_350030000 [Leishmania donovani]CAM72174.1 conserved hypothetical protein [Leishmania infantum JPCM5]CBZ38150.1 hypothetical protein, conserved [Leishmania donovani]SUZ46076.1 hypothetical_protein_-_conserved [Leishmania infantum]|eukprot:XP_001469075.1 conserved hypothetical protein [Leishmania infantum JPCM5]
MATEDELRELLPKMRFNKEFKKKQKYKYKKRVEAREKEREMITGKRRPASKQIQSASDGAKAKTTATKKSGGAGTAGAKGKPKTRVPKLKVANVETGKETLTKKKARELVQENRKKKISAKKEPKLAAKSTRAGAVTAAVVSTETLEAKQSRARVTKDELPATAAQAASLVEPKQTLTQAERDRELLARAIRGDDLLGSDAATGVADGVAFIRQDPSLYPDHAFLDDYAEKKHAEAVSADELLKNAHHFFKKLSKRERALNKVAKEHINHLRAVNRRGGDKQGFRYVVPKNVKQVVRELISAQKARDGEEDPESLIDTEQLVSTFGGDGVAETSEKPVRRSRRRRSRTYSDFYQFQVSRRWTRNAENFLKRSRPNKLLFEAKKHQRTIKHF